MLCLDTFPSFQEKGNLHETFSGTVPKTVPSKDWNQKIFFSFHNLLSGSESKQDNKMSSTKELVFESNKTVVLTSYCDSYCL